ncbi:MAG: hypothetical protein R8M14_09160 [Ghiorsea sp.]
MSFRAFKYSLLFLSCLFFATPSYALGPRLVYVEPASTIGSSNESLLGRYLYMGVIFADDNPAGFAGPSVKLGLGKTGKKLNISFVTGSRPMSFELGVSYIKQDADATLFLNPEHKGYAVEASFRLQAVSVIGVFGKENTSIEFGLGF